MAVMVPGEGAFTRPSCCYKGFSFVLADPISFSSIPRIYPNFFTAQPLRSLQHLNLAVKEASESIRDVEKDAVDETCLDKNLIRSIKRHDTYLQNSTIHSLAWHTVDVTVEHDWRSDMYPKSILAKIDGHAEAGTVLRAHRASCE